MFFIISTYKKKEKNNLDDRRDLKISKTTKKNVKQNISLFKQSTKKKKDN